MSTDMTEVAFPGRHQKQNATEADSHPAVSCGDRQRDHAEIWTLIWKVPVVWRLIDTGRFQMHHDKTTRKAISTLVDFHLFADWLARTAFYAAPSPDCPDSGKAILLHFSPSCGCICAPLTWKGLITTCNLLLLGTGCHALVEHCPLFPWPLIGLPF